MDLGSSTAPEALLRNKGLLLVEDEFLVSMMIENELMELGATVVGSAASVNEALWLIEETAPVGGLHVAILDLDIDGGPVLPVASRLARLGVPFVFVTGYEQGYNTDGHEAPVLQKPFVMKQLITTLATLASTAR
jgi:CheY-like chemotaxis protein